MKKWSSLLFLMVLVSSAFAQKMLRPANVEWGMEYRRPGFSAVEKIISSDGNGTYVWRNQVKGLMSLGIVLEHYNQELSLIKSANLDLPNNTLSNDFQVVDIIPFGGNIVMLSAIYDNRANENTLLVQEIDKKSLKLKGKLQEVAKIEAKRRLNKGGFDYAISRDSSKILMYANLPFERRAGEQLSLTVYDDNLDKQWTKKVELPFRDRDFQVENYEVDRNGNVYILGKLLDRSNMTLFSNRPYYSYVIVAYRDKGRDVKQYDVSLGDDFITDLTIRVGNDGDLICAGFYSERTTQSMKGSFFSKINAETKRMYDIRKGEFDSEFLSQFMSERRARKKRELYNYRIDRLVLRSDGGALIVAEQFFVRVTTQTDANGFTTTTTTYYYNDIITINMNPDGSIEWATRIPKRQIDGSGFFSSYAMTISQGKIYFIYNDHPKNLTRTDYRKIKNFNGKRSAVTLVVLSPDGSYKKYPLFNNRDEGILMQPRIAQQVSADEMVIYGIFKRRYKFGRITF